MDSGWMKKLFVALFVIGAIIAVCDCLDPFTPDPDLLPVNVTAKSVVLHPQVIQPLCKVCLLPLEVAAPSRDVGSASFGADESFPPENRTFVFRTLRI